MIGVGHQKTLTFDPQRAGLLSTDERPQLQVRCVILLLGMRAVSVFPPNHANHASGGYSQKKLVNIEQGKRQDLTLPIRDPGLLGHNFRGLHEQQY